MRSITVIAIFLFSWNTYSQDLIGNVEDGSSKLPLHGAHVRNLSKNQLVTTGPDGAFQLPVSLGDSILITFVGYEHYFMVVRKEHLLKRLSISLNEQEVTLDDVVVTPFTEYAEKPVIELDSVEAVPLKLPEATYEFNYDPREEPIPDKNESTFGTGIRFNMEKFTKRHKEKVHYSESRDRDQKWKIAELKFNRERLTEITKLEGDDLTNFIAYCNFSVDYLAQASELDIQFLVLEKLEKYKSESKPR